MRNATEKSYKQYSYTSRYSPFPYYYSKDEDKYFSGLTAYLDNTTVYTVHTVKQGDTLDTLALDYYNSQCQIYSKNTHKHTNYKTR